MNKTTIIISGLSLLVLVVLVAAYFWYAMAQPLYNW